MIRKLYANKKQFKAVEFKLGLNIILAEKESNSTKKDTRNGVGKSTLINIIHFCLGADYTRCDLPLEEIHDWIFSIEIDICGRIITASRSISSPGLIIVEGDFTGLVIQPEHDDKEKICFFKDEGWKKLLGIYLFGIREESKLKYKPSFRSLISYFIRRKSDAYISPFSYFRSQKTWDAQLHNAFLLGLNWQRTSELQVIKDKETAIKSMTAALKAGFIPSQGELEAERVQLQTEIELEREALATFQVHPQYQEIQREANLLTKDIHEFTNKNIVLQNKLDRYIDSVQSEHAPEATAIEDFYKEVGLCFPDSLKRTLSEAKKFHSTIVENRKKFLESEILEIKRNIADNEVKKQNFIIQRSELMQILHTHRALEEILLLQERHLEKKERLETIKTKISDIKNLNARKQEVKAQRLELESRMTRDYEQARDCWEQAVSIFNENSKALYNEAGKLIIDVSSNGYKFDVEIERSKSEGVGKMKIFCYDLMLVELQAAQGKINFLMHDSTIFDGVESRQTALALEYAHKKAITLGFQYICAFNSDLLPTDEFSEGFNINDFVRLRLYDKDDKDSLLGFRFNILTNKK